MQRAHLVFGPDAGAKPDHPPTPRSFHPPRFTLHITLQLALANRCSRLGCRPQHARKPTLIVGLPSIISSPLLSPHLSFSPNALGSNREGQTSARNPSTPLLHCARMLKRGGGNCWGICCTWTGLDRLDREIVFADLVYLKCHKNTRTQYLYLLTV